MLVLPACVSVFTCTASQHGGHETTLVSFHFSWLHHGMIVVGVPYTEQRLLNIAELAIARFQGSHVAQTTNALVAGRKIVG